MEINEKDGFLLVLIKTIGNKIKWIILLFAIIVITVIGIQANKISKLESTISDMQLYIQKLEFDTYD